MKIALEAQYAWSPTPRGIHHYTIQMIRSLLKRRNNNYELIFFDFNQECGNRARIEQHFGEYNIPIHECNILDYRVARSDRNIFGEKSYNEYTGAYADIFHFFHLITIPDNLKGKMVVTIHDMIPLKYPEACPAQLNDWFRIGLERLDRMQPTVIAISEATKMDILEYTNIPEEKIHVVHNGCSKRELDPPNKLTVLKQMGIDFPYILFLGGIGGHKNVERLVNAFALIADKLPDVKLLIAGNPEPTAEAEVLRIKANSYYNSKILMPGYVTEEQKYALYSGAVAYFLPSLYEGFGLPILEAMACGCPVITSNVSSLPEVAGDAAILIDPYDIEQMAYEMERVVTSESLREKLKLKGLERCKMFSWAKTAEMTEAVYEAAAKR